MLNVEWEVFDTIGLMIPLLEPEVKDNHPQVEQPQVTIYDLEKWLEWSDTRQLRAVELQPE